MEWEIRRKIECSVRKKKGVKRGKEREIESEKVREKEE